MGRICKERWGINTKTKHRYISAQNGICIAQRHVWLMLGPLLERIDSVDLKAFDSSRRDRPNERTFTAIFLR